MIYSRWKPAEGGYDYFEGQDKGIPLGNDLPRPTVPRGTDIGTASVDCGRPIPVGAKYVGSGQEAVGLISPIKTSALGSLEQVIPSHFLWAAAGILGGWYLTKKKVI